MYKETFINKMNDIAEEGFVYRSFYENLEARLDQEEITSVNVLGKDFFNMVDRFTIQLFIQRAGDSLLLELSREEFLWELQIFVNQYIRGCCSSPLKLRAFCASLAQKLREESFYKEFMADIELSYEKHFYMEDCATGYLI
ncbi:MAG: hypothetical protein HQM11_02410 [SAR324 cluster bacterium]|nr:hypothetical protein [SAR324 cluster bacterium]